MKIAMIVCWMGRLPDYFELWEYSCSKNSEYDFLVFTDHPQNSKFDNVRFIKFSLNDFNELASKKLKIEVNVERPYKLCDFRPAYGVIFEDYLKEYNFWGHCDIDQIFGTIRNFVTDDILDKYEKINKNGHFVLYRNVKKINNLFKESGSLFNYTEVFKSNENFAFDEYTGINMIANKQSIKFYYINNFADIDKSVNRYICKNHKNYKYQFYEYSDGKILKKYYNNNLKEEEMMYIHFQKKVPKIVLNNFDKSIGIGYKMFCNIDGDITRDVIESINGYEKRSHDYFEKILYIMGKIKDFLISSREKKIIWVKQKKSGEEYK